MFLGMEVSDNVSSGRRNQDSGNDGSLRYANERRLQCLDAATRTCTLYQNGTVGSRGASGTEAWSEIEAMSPMSPMDKVTEFLVHSQSMLQNYSQIHHLDLPNVRLEINNEYPPSDDENSAERLCDEITDLKLEATVFRNSLKGKPPKGDNSVVSHATNSAEPNVSDLDAAASEVPSVSGAGSAAGATRSSHGGKQTDV